MSWWCWCARVLWVDANVEIRRPLDEIRALLARNGHFATIQRLRFPNGLRHHPTTVLGLGCHAPPATREQCWSGVLGVVRDSWFHHSVRALLRMCWAASCVRCGCGCVAADGWRTAAGAG